MTTLNDSIPDLKIEHIDDGIGEGLIMLEQDSCGNIDRVAIHPIHLRYMAEKFGLVETSDPQALKTIATLQRRMKILRDRIDHLGDWLTNHSDRQHANLDNEITYLEATACLADEWCAEMAADASTESVLVPCHATSRQQAAIVASAQDWDNAQPASRPSKECNVAPLSTTADRVAVVESDSTKSKAKVSPPPFQAATLPVETTRSHDVTALCN